MNILITGANGLLGTHLTQWLSREHHIFAVVKDIENIRFARNRNITLIETDLGRIDETIFPQQIDVIYYLAQSNRFREFPEGTEDMLSINVVAPNQIARWAVKNNVKTFVYASSGGVYTNPDKPVKEFFDINANEKLGFYLNSKLSAEMLLKNYASLFETFVIIRPFFMYGPGQNKSMLIPRLIDNIKHGKEIILNGTEGIRINPIYISDVAEAIAKIVNLKGEYIINIAGEEIITLKKLGMLIGDILGEQPIFTNHFQPQNDLVSDIKIMKNLLGIPKVSLTEGLEKMVALR